MNSHFLLEKLISSEEFKKFKKENPDSYLCSGFFVIDLESKTPDNKYHFDYYVSDSKNTFSFELEDGVKLVPLERNDEKVLEEVSMKKPATLPLMELSGLLITIITVIKILLLKAD